MGAGRHGFYAVPVTETQEPQAVIGSNLHRLAYPEQYREHVERNKGQLKVAFEHPGRDISEPFLMPGKQPEVLSLQARGEYLYAACGEMGLRVFDIAFTDHKGFSERMSTAPVSPFGQKFFVRTRFATSVAAPTTIAPDPTRKHFPENQESPVHLMYAFIYVTDKYEGLVMVGAGTLLDGDPLNNFLKKDIVFNPDNILAGADSITFHGTHAHIGCDAGLVTIDLSNPKEPKVTQVLGGPAIGRPRAMTTQGRYGFVADDQSLVTLDLTDPAHPRPVANLPFQASSRFMRRAPTCSRPPERAASPSSISRTPNRPRLTRFMMPRAASTTPTTSSWERPTPANLAMSPMVKMDCESCSSPRRRPRVRRDSVPVRCLCWCRTTR